GGRGEGGAGPAVVVQDVNPADHAAAVDDGAEGGRGPGGEAVIEAAEDLQRLVVDQHHGRVDVQEVPGDRPGVAGAVEAGVVAEAVGADVAIDTCRHVDAVAAGGDVDRVLDGRERGRDRARVAVRPQGRDDPVGRH